MFKFIKEDFQDSDAVVDVRPEMKTPQEGRIYFTLVTDGVVDSKLKDFQPTNSTVFVEDGDIVEFDVRIGSWSETKKSEMINKIRSAVRLARKESYVPPVRVDMGGASLFVPHIRSRQRASSQPFVGFLEALVEEIKAIADIHDMNTE